MRLLIPATALALAFATASVAQTSGPARPAAARPGATAVKEPRPDNGSARRDADERQKRWDDRMKRATRSMCNGC